jgi:hypothetical protein
MQILHLVLKVLKGKRVRVVLKVVLAPKVVRVEKVQPEHKARPDLLVLLAPKVVRVQVGVQALKGQ